MLDLHVSQLHWLVSVVARHVCGTSCCYCCFKPYSIRIVLCCQFILVVLQQVLVLVSQNIRVMC